jgi:hypothetical protein
VGANWMFSNNKISNLISDSHAIGKMKTSKYYSNPIVNGILNLNLDTKKIVYARYTNIFISVGTQFYNNIVLYYEYPTDFLNKNKNKSTITEVLKYLNENRFFIISDGWSGAENALHSLLKSLIKQDREITLF